MCVLWVWSHRWQPPCGEPPGSGGAATLSAGWTQHHCNCKWKNYLLLDLLHTLVCSYSMVNTFQNSCNRHLMDHQGRWGIGSVLPKVYWAPVLRTSGSWNLPVQMEGSLVRNFNNYYVLLIHVFDGCSNRLDPCDHFNLVCCCLSPVLIEGHVERFRKVSNPYDWMLKCLYRFKKNQSVLQRCLSNFRAIGRLKKA